MAVAKMCACKENPSVMRNVRKRLVGLMWGLIVVGPVDVGVFGFSHCIIVKVGHSSRQNQHLLFLPRPLSRITVPGTSLMSRQL